MEQGRWALHAKAVWWRSLMSIGMFLHRLGPPRPLSPRFVIKIPSTLATLPGRIKLVLYAPSDYRKLNNDKRYPVLINFHGGGFTLGSPTDDARWAVAVVKGADTVVCSVGYRRAPEHPFPTAIEDGVDAILYLLDHAEELKIDKDRIGISGFSSGGNMCFSVPLRLEDALLRRRGAEGSGEPASNALLERERQVIKVIVAWYPKTDYTRPREEGMLAVNIPSSKVLSMLIPKLSDAACLYPSSSIKLDSPFLSPGVASGELLRLLPKDVVLYSCELDGLWAEGERFRDRLKWLGKDVVGETVMGARHAYDRLPYVRTLWREYPLMKLKHRDACQELNRVFHGSSIQRAED
ncbi:hypothetical protein FRB94_013256 [Tulasnella sp. JGI-2019a]|nr:hypothetical protein FRB93_001962 [Tulasnella sp. JGI-2019a]KAG9008432.1 hypothetical protein FRB94_013256 [Tulasnella sp. JGI-2019a]